MRDTPKRRYWLHCYSQRRPGQEEATAANCVERMSPAEFLLHLKTEWPQNENLLHWSTEITAAEFKKLDGQL